jgi:phosphohistidine phosphatase SixA
MKLILSRHAPQNMDALQALSSEGKKLLGKMIRHLKMEGYAPEYIYASPSLRTKETAEIISEAFHCPLEVEEALKRYDAQKLLEIVKAFPQETLLFVGHAPTITEFAQSLVSEPVPEIGLASALIFRVDKSKRCLISVPIAHITPQGVIQL